jgi:uncharacterized protein
MRLDRLIQTLLPHDEKFYQFFEESAENIIEAAGLLKVLAHARPADRGAIVEKIHEVEHRGDNITHKIFGELNATFVTPFDREDIQHLTSELDDILDFIDGAASRIHLYKIAECTPEMVKLMEILEKSVKEIRRGVSLLRDFRNSDELLSILRAVNDDENAADAVFERAVANLFENEKDPINVIKMKEVYVVLETATDACEDAANVMETLLIKHG